MLLGSLRTVSLQTPIGGERNNRNPGSQVLPLFLVLDLEMELTALGLPAKTIGVGSLLWDPFVCLIVCFGIIFGAV